MNSPTIDKLHDQVMANMQARLKLIAQCSPQILACERLSGFLNRMHFNTEVVAHIDDTACVCHVTATVSRISDLTEALLNAGLHPKPTDAHYGRECWLMSWAVEFEGTNVVLSALQMHPYSKGVSA